MDDLSWSQYDPVARHDWIFAHWNEYLELCRLFHDTATHSQAGLVLTDDTGRMYRLESVSDDRIVWRRVTHQSYANKLRQQLEAAKGLMWLSDASECTLIVERPTTAVTA